MSESREPYTVATTATSILAPAHAIEPDEQAVVEAMRAVERSNRPGLLSLYYNGSAWVMYDNTRPRYLQNY